MGLAFLGDLARQRSLASAALLFLLLVDEIEGLVFLAVGVVARRVDLFLASQDVIFPAIVMVAGAVSLARNWRRRQAAIEEPMEMLDLGALIARTGELHVAAATGAASPAAPATSPYELWRGRTSPPGSR